MGGLKISSMLEAFERGLELMDVYILQFSIPLKQD